MKKLFIILFMILSGMASTQSMNAGHSKAQDKAAIFPEGNFIEYVNKNLKLTKEEIAQGGDLLVEFTVTTEGKVQAIKFLKSYSKIVDAKVFQILREMPEWAPAEKNGDKANSVHTLPITLKP